MTEYGKPYVEGECAPKVENATLVCNSPIIVSFECKCGNNWHSWTSTAYDAVATMTDKDGHWPANAQLRME